MSFQQLIESAKKHFPDLEVKYKDQSSFMKFLGTLLFFNKAFMVSYTTTIGSTIYFPNESFVNVRPASSAVVLLHELVHVKDAKKFSKPLFSFLYLSPQILILLCLPLFLISWKLALPLLLLCASPIPSYFRMYFERRAYCASLYSVNALSKKLNFEIDLDNQKKFILTQFKGPFYYFMWPFGNLEKYFDNVVDKVKANQRPFEDPIFDIIDDLVTVV